MLRDQSERSKWSREQAQNLVLHIFSHIIIIIIRCSGMFRNVLGGSMFLVLSTAKFNDTLTIKRDNLTFHANVCNFILLFSS